MKFMKHLEEAIDTQRDKSKNLALILGGKVPAEGKKSFEESTFLMERVHV